MNLSKIENVCFILSGYAKDISGVKRGKRTYKLNCWLMDCETNCRL